MPVILIAACGKMCNACEADEDGEMTCRQCVSSYGFEEGCAACPSSCLECIYKDADMFCTRCETGFFTQNGECQSK